MSDLIVLVADKNMEFTLRGILERHRSLRIRPLEYELLTHSERDPGCYLRGHELLRLYTGKFDHALLVFDREGCGQGQRSREQLENEVEDRLSQSGWDNQAAAIVLDPELEVWIWSESPHVARSLGWSQSPNELRRWLEAKGMVQPGRQKPQRPKETVEEVLQHTNTPRSSAIYQRIAENVSLRGCVDPAFLKLKETLRAWFAQ